MESEGKNSRNRSNMPIRFVYNSWRISLPSLATRGLTKSNAAIKKVRFILENKELHHTNNKNY